ncbi:hypothetical protein BASA83_009947 [Batrachochytrium salamandrivorans]|nr:hypothetical protein BASA83_009947 [Batrachochytrium salamandrivorans]
MKVNVLVAAAMTITSVSASGKGGLGGLFKKGGGMKGSGSSYDTLDNELEPGSSQKSPRRGIHPKHLSPVKKTQSAILSSGNYKLHGAKLVLLIVCF